MAETWEKQMRDFLKHVGDELKRTGEELKTEAQHLIEEVRDPKRQAQVRDELRKLSTWARETTRDAADRIEVAVRRVEDAFERRPGAGFTSAPEAGAPGGARKSAAKKGTRKTAAKKAPAGKTRARKSAARKPRGGA